MKIEIIIDNQIFEIKCTCTVNKEGNLIYSCETLNTSISTFNYRTNYQGSTQEESLKKIAFELRRALDELSEI